MNEILEMIINKIPSRSKNSDDNRLVPPIILDNYTLNKVMRVNQNIKKNN